ncbi:unnamed protein product [Parnassius mnemosyne]|uniref:Reverse transcriptase domain-containing protein n=1 Tax=Parnassius mnemosyne TaxID=213953 RepID=A0AAV1LK86_9NEOP
MAESLEDLSTMLNDLNSVSQWIDLKTNMDKTKIMFNVHVSLMPVVVRSTKLKVVDEYVYLGQIVRLVTATGIDLRADKTLNEKTVTVTDRAIRSVVYRVQTIWYYKDFIWNMSSTKKQLDKDIEFLHSVSNMVTVLSEIKMALQHLKNGKALGEDGITAKLLKAGGRPVLEVLQKLFNSVLHGGITPEAWSRSAVILFFKKGDNALLKNYRPISLLSRVYVLFSRVITNRLARRLDDFQPPEQAGFRKGFSTIDHIHTLRQVVQKPEEYNLPLCLAYVDYEKAFDSVEIWAVLQSLQRCQVDCPYSEVLKCLYSRATMAIRVQNQSTKPIQLQRGVRQGDVISPKLFTAALEDVFKLLDWKGYGINIKGEYITHLRFADDIVLMAESLEGLSTMLNDLNSVSQRIGLKMNMDKTKIMFNVHVTPMPVVVGSTKLDVVDEYVYLEQIVRQGKNLRSFSDVFYSLESSDGESAFSNKDVQDHLNTLIVAGYDTVATSLVITLLLIGSYKEVQDKIYNELEEVFGQSDRDVEKQDLPRLAYMEAVIKESLRLYPIAPVIARLLDKDLKISKTYATMWLKTLISHFIRKYQVTGDHKNLLLKYDFLLKPYSGYYIAIEKRK